MQDIIFYVDASNSIGTVTNITNNGNGYAPPLVHGVSVCLRMRVFASSENADAYPISSLGDVTHWVWRMDSDFNRGTPYKVNADNENITVRTVTENVNGKNMSFTEFAIPISDMNTQELAAWLGNNKALTGLTGELIGYNNSGKAIFDIQVDGFTMRNSLGDLDEPTPNDDGYLTSSETELLISSAVAAKQDRLTSANAGAGIAIDSGGTISMACPILGATNGVKIADGKVQFDPETAIGANGSTKGAIVSVSDGLLVAGGTASIDDASVADVMVGIEGGNASINDEVVTPGNLRGALSVGQAVDVSCKPYNNSGNIVYTDPDAGFISGFTCSMVSGTKIGFYDSTTHKFPKFASGLKYLMIADVAGSGSITPNGGSAVALSGTAQRIAMNVTAANTGYFSASAAATVNVANWRQYEVTALTDEAIAYLAQLPDPDAFFRSSTIFQVRDKYLVKQDMVCPWIYTIDMGRNTDMTVAAGLSYKIQYTDNNTHNVTVDTIPADAYGWDTHVQMFVKGASNVVFQPPLILMDALTSNAGHNLVIKYRNGDALVYVDDTNAGNIVIYASGSTAGTLDYCLAQDPGAGNANYIIFGAAVDGATCSMNDSAVAYDTNIIGNGTDKTAISGTFGMASGKTANLQDLTVAGSTVNGAGTVGVNNVVVSGSLNVASGATLNFNGTNTLDAAVTGTGKLAAGDGSTLTSTIPAGGTVGTGVISGMTFSSALASGDATLSNITITECIVKASIAGPTANKHVIIENCNISGNTNGSGNVIFTRYNNAYVYVKGSTVVNASAAQTNMFVSHPGSYIIVEDSVIGGCGLYKGTLVTKGVTTYTARMGVITGATLGKYVFAPGSTTSTTYIDNDFYPTIYAAIGSYEPTTNTVTEEGVATFIVAGKTFSMSGCKFGAISTGGGVTDVVCGNMDLWSAENVIFASPLDAREASTVKLSGTTFTSASLISREPMRIQLPAGSTNSLSGNTNAANTKILHAPIIVVSDDSASGPNGSATIVTATGTTTCQGLGTYIAKDGSNDFTTGITNVTTSDGLGAALTDANRWTKLANGLTTSAAFTADTTVNGDTIITNEYEPVFGGTYSVSSGGTLTVSEADKTATVAGGTMTMIDTVVPKGATVVVSTGGGLAVSSVGGGGTIDLGKTAIPAAALIQVSGVTLTNGLTTAQSTNNGSGGVFRLDSGSVGVSNAAFVANSSTVLGACAYIRNGATMTVANTVLNNNNCSVNAGCFYTNGVLNISSCTFSSNTAKRGGILYVGDNGHVTITDSEITSCNATGLGGAVALYGNNADLTLVNCYVHDNGETNGAFYVRTNGVGSAHLIISGSTIQDSIYMHESPTSTTFSGTNVFGSTVSGAGAVVITSGAILDLTGNTNATPINPGGNITLHGGASTAPTVIVYGSGSVVGSRRFEDLEIHGTSISNQGIIYGATVYAPADADHYIYYTADNGATSDSVIVRGSTAYVVSGGLVGVSGT